MMVEDNALEVTWMPVGELEGYAGNAKTHTHQQIDQIALSIQEFGFNDPVGIWHRPDGTAEIVEGHGRVMAARQLGMSTVPVITLDALTDEQRRAYAIVHNKLTMNTDFDVDALVAELDALDYDWDDYGFASDVETADEIAGELEETVKPELPFTGYVDEESNYVVLTFHTSQDWTRAQSLLGLEEVQGYSTKRGDGGKIAYTGVGRVIDGNEAFERIAKAERELES